MVARIRETFGIRVIILDLVLLDRFTMCPAVAASPAGFADVDDN